MDPGIGPARRRGTPWSASQSGQGLLHDLLHRSPAGLALPAAKVRAVELDDEQKMAFHQAPESSRRRGAGQPA